MNFEFLSWFNFNFDVDAFLDIAGSDPLYAMWYFFVHGGWILFIWVILWGALHLFVEHKQAHAVMAREWVIYRVHVPKMSEQTPRAAENMFASFAGGHQGPSWTDTWLKGFTQTVISLEIASINGAVGFYIRCERRLRDMVEAAVYAQYPDAELIEVEDYTLSVPKHYPDEEWDLWGAEIIPTRKGAHGGFEDAYPIKTYPEFEDKVSGEFKDPIANILEVFSRFGPGEQAWYQILLVPTDQADFRKRAEKVIDKIKGVKKEVKKTALDFAIDLPINITKDFANVLLSTPQEAPKKDAKADFPKLFALSPQEKEILEAVERKAGKIGFDCKIRFAYLAKREVFNKSHFAQPFIGAIKQTNTFHMQALKPDFKKTGMGSALWFFKDKRNNERKTRLVKAYASRSGWKGMPRFFLSTEELATLWHFPILQQVKAPSLTRIEAKKSEAPANLPFG